MRILIVANAIPMRDRSAGWYRFNSILRIFATKHHVFLHPFNLEGQIASFGRDEVERYRLELENCGIRTTSGNWADLNALLRLERFDAVLFEHYNSTGDTLDHVRFWQPRAVCIVDSIDVNFSRLAAKARLTKKATDFELAQKVKSDELASYHAADLVIAVSESDRALLAREDSGLRITVIPLIYSVPPLLSKLAKPIRDVIFVADFAHDANVDGILYFCRQVLPLVVARFPDARLRIVGGSPPREVQELAGPNVEVLGYVQDIQPLYASSDVAIAPMRFGGGLKGKIAEAMAFGLPVVTNTACLEGFGLTPGDNVMVGDTPIEMAGAVARLFEDPALYDKIRTTGWEFVRQNYSKQIIAERVNEMLGQLDRHPRKRLSASERLRRNVRIFMERHLLWRLKTGPNKMRGKT